MVHKARIKRYQHRDESKYMLCQVQPGVQQSHCGIFYLLKKTKINIVFSFKKTIGIQSARTGGVSRPSYPLL